MAYIEKIDDDYFDFLETFLLNITMVWSELCSYFVSI